MVVVLVLRKSSDILAYPYGNFCYKMQNKSRYCNKEADYLMHCIVKFWAATCADIAAKRILLQFAAMSAYQYYRLRRRQICTTSCLQFRLGNAT